MSTQKYKFQLYLVFSKKKLDHFKTSASVLCLQICNIPAMKEYLDLFISQFTSQFVEINP
jgi:hypothetical protein